MAAASAVSGTAGTSQNLALSGGVTDFSAANSTKMVNGISRYRRPCIVDGTNVAMAYGKHSYVAIEGIWIVVQYWKQKGHKVKVVLRPLYGKEYNSYERHKHRRANADDRKYRWDLLDELEKEEGLILWAKKRRFYDTARSFISVNPYDDLFIVDLALKLGGFIVSQDNYRDIVQKYDQKYRDIVNFRVLGFYDFVDKNYFPFLDPNGAQGLTKDEFVLFPAGESPPAPEIVVPPPPDESNHHESRSRSRNADVDEDPFGYRRFMSSERQGRVASRSRERDRNGESDRHVAWNDSHEAPLNNKRVPVWTANTHRAQDLIDFSNAPLTASSSGGVGRNLSDQELRSSSNRQAVGYDAQDATRSPLLRREVNKEGERNSPEMMDFEPSPPEVGLLDAFSEEMLGDLCGLRGQDGETLPMSQEAFLESQRRLAESVFKQQTVPQSTRATGSSSVVNNPPKRMSVAMQLQATGAPASCTSSATGTATARQFAGGVSTAKSNQNPGSAVTSAITMRNPGEPPIRHLFAPEVGKKLPEASATASAIQPAASSSRPLIEPGSVFSGIKTEVPIRPLIGPGSVTTTATVVSSSSSVPVSSRPNVPLKAASAVAATTTKTTVSQSTSSASSARVSSVRSTTDLPTQQQQRTESAKLAAAILPLVSASTTNNDNDNNGVATSGISKAKPVANDPQKPAAAKAFNPVQAATIPVKHSSSEKKELRHVIYQQLREVFPHRERFIYEALASNPESVDYIDFETFVLYKIADSSD